MAEHPRKRRNRLQIALVAALAISLLGNALAIGAGLRLRALRADLLGPAAEAAFFPRDIRQALRAALAAERDTLLPDLHALARIRAQLVADAMARPFDRAAVEADMALLRQQADRLLATVQGIVADTLEARARQEK